MWKKKIKSNFRYFIILIMLLWYFILDISLNMIYLILNMSNVKVFLIFKKKKMKKELCVLKVQLFFQIFILTENFISSYIYESEK